MSKYTLIQIKRDTCTRCASAAVDSKIAAFYVHAVEGYQMQLDAMTLEEAREEVIKGANWN